MGLLVDTLRMDCIPVFTQLLALMATLSLSLYLSLSLCSFFVSVSMGPLFLLWFYMLCLCIVLTSKLSEMNNVKANKSAHKEYVRDLSFSWTDLKFCSCSDDDTIKVWDFARCQEKRSWKLYLTYRVGFGEPVIFSV
ncbi:hypothetical protein AMTRI_Chr01g105350 [Amborella trichopoda]